MTANSKRNIKVDQLRGWLILLVIIGHIVLGTVHDNPIRYAIYAFHMPIFIALSGFLINPRSLRESAMTSILARYSRRVLMPFLLAFIFFTGVLAVHAWQEGRFGAEWALSHLITPYYHLWFIPTLVIWVIAYAFILKLKFPLWLVLTVSFLVSFIWAAAPLTGLVEPLQFLLDKKVVYFFLFFMFGVWLRVKSPKRLADLADTFNLPLFAAIAVAFISYLFAIGESPTPARAVAWLALNLLGFIFCWHWFKTKSKQSPAWFGSLLSDMGRLSLPIYLWHVVPMFILKGFNVHSSQILIYYAVSIMSCALIVWLIIRLENHSPLLGRWLYGQV
ncbi:MAG: acyltransferase [Pseudomonadota bacterium]